MTPKIKKILAIILATIASIAWIYLTGEWDIQKEINDGIDEIQQEFMSDELWLN